jgi:plasmid stabilization system protein ParE
MDLKIIWSDFSETQLDEIYEYYKKRASLKVATKIVTGIIKESEKLIKTSFIGQEEELLKDREIQYRYLVFKNYKVIYSVDEKSACIKIADVFDTRQNPSKMKIFISCPSVYIFVIQCLPGFIFSANIFFSKNIF